MNTETISLKSFFSKIGFGGASLSGTGGGYGFGDVSESISEGLIRRALELGVSVFDTAPIYGFGLSEQRLGRYLKVSDKAVIVSKSGVDWHSNRRVNMTNHPENTIRMLNESLDRLNRDFIDVYMVHWPDPRIDIRETMEVLIRAQEAGKIRHIGLSNTNLEDLGKATEIAKIEVFQGEHNLWTQQAYKLAEAQSNCAFFMGWGTFDKGILTGRVHSNRKFETSDARSWAPWWKHKEVNIKIEKVRKLESLLLSYDLSLADFCLAFSQMNTRPVCSLIGFKSIADLEQICESNQKIVPEPLLQQIYNEWIRKVENYTLF